MPSSNLMKIGLIQMSMGEAPGPNMRKAMEGVREAAAGGAEVVCLPELFRTRYFCQSEDAALFALAEPIPGPSTEALAELAAELDVTVVASLFERRAAGLYHNTAAVLDGARGYVGKYRKMHIPDDPRFYEKFYFTPGDLGFKSFETEHGDLGVLICWDQWYPEAARLTALRGAEVLIYPTAIGWHPEEKARLGERQHDAWELAQRAHAVANGYFMGAINRVGTEAPWNMGTFYGTSYFVNPRGEFIVEGSEDNSELIVGDLDLSMIDTVRETWQFFRDRRPEAYDELVDY